MVTSSLICASEHMHNKFEVNWTKIKGGYQSEKNVATLFLRVYGALRLWKTDWPYCAEFQSEVRGVVSLLFYLKVNKKLAGREPHMAPFS